jgi:hypothetical protein
MGGHAPVPFCRAAIRAAERDVVVIEGIDGLE